MNHFVGSELMVKLSLARFLKKKKKKKKKLLLAPKKKNKKKIEPILANNV